MSFSVDVKNEFKSKMVKMEGYSGQEEILMFVGPGGDEEFTPIRIKRGEKKSLPIESKFPDADVITIKPAEDFGKMMGTNWWIQIRMGAPHDYDFSFPEGDVKIRSITRSGLETTLMLSGGYPTWTLEIFRPRGAHNIHIAQTTNVTVGDDE